MGLASLQRLNANIEQSTQDTLAAACWLKQLNYIFADLDIKMPSI